MCSDFKITFMWDNSTLNFLCRGQGGNAKLMSMTCIIRVSAWVDEEYTFSQTQGSLNWNRKITFGMQIYLLLIYLSKNDLLSTYPMPSTVVQLNSFFFFLASFHVTLSIYLTLSSPLPMSISLYSLCLLFPGFPENKFFSIIFLDSVYMH